MNPSTFNGRRSPMGIPEIYLRAPVRSVVLAFGHLALFALTYFIAFALRFDFELTSDLLRFYWSGVLWIAGLKLAVFCLLSHYHGWWRFVTFTDLAALFRASTLALLLIVAVDHFAAPDQQIPRAVVLLDWLLTILLIGGLRCSYRFLRETCHPLLSQRDCRKVLIIGANEVTGRLAQQIRLSRQLDYHVVGFLDQNLSKRGLCLGGISVLGSLDDLPELAKLHRVKDVLAIDSQLAGKEIRRLVKVCDELGLALRIIPAVEWLLSRHYASQPGNGRRLHVRDVNIEEVLRREPVQLDGEQIAELLCGRNVMVTGAGGSIGSEICRQIVRYAPQSLMMAERFENNLFEIDRELRQAVQAPLLSPLIANVTDATRMRQIFSRQHVDVVFHAAAHKHVTMMEQNPGEAIKNNVLGTRCVADLCHEFGTDTFVMISTDKAVNPTSVMGLTKQLAERYIQCLSRRSRTRFVAVRFGNVLGSVGSVVPIFQEQIRKGGPVTVTHPEVRRFFMTIPEASQLVLQAAAMGHGGEIFILDMGEPVKIVDLARDLIRLSGLQPDDIEIVYTGMRPGEKQFEELYSNGEKRIPSEHSKIWIVEHQPHDAKKTIDDVRHVAAITHKSDEIIRQTLRAIVLDEAGADTRFQGVASRVAVYEPIDSTPANRLTAKTILSTQH